MSLFPQPRWLRRWIRRRMNPLPVDKAALWKGRISIFYSIVAWNALGWVGYMVYTGRNDWAKYYGYKTDEEAQLPQGIDLWNLFYIFFFFLFTASKHFGQKNVIKVRPTQ